jgi:hypothetical protein
MEEIEIDEFGYAKRKPVVYSWNVQDRDRTPQPIRPREGYDDDGWRSIVDETGITYTVNVGAGYYRQMMEAFRQQWIATELREGKIPFSEAIDAITSTTTNASGDFEISKPKKEQNHQCFEDYKPYKRRFWSK